MKDEESYELFLKNNPMCDFAQSISWNKIKSYWQNEQIIIRDSEEIKLTINILIRKVPIFGVLMYVPRGPVGEIHNKRLLKELTEKLRCLAKKHHAFVILMEPDINVNDTEFIAIAKELGYKINSKSKSFSEEVQARHNLRLNLEGKSEEEVLASFSSKTRYNIKLAAKKGVEVKELGVEGLKDFYELLKITGIRDDFIIRPIKYYESLFKEFDNIYILTAYYKNKPIASILPLSYGNKTWYLYGASGNEYRNLMPNYLLQWEAIKKAIGNNSILYDFKGCSFKNNEPDGLYRFKKGFGTELVELIGEVNLEIKPLRYHVFKISKKIFCKLRKIKYRHKTKS